MIGKNSLLFIVVMIMALSSAIADEAERSPFLRNLKYDRKPNQCGKDCVDSRTCDTKCSACIADPDDAEGDVPRLKCREPPV